MSRQLGIEVGGDRVRAVLRRGRRGVETFDLPYDGEAPDAVIAALQARVGDVQGIALAFGLAHLHVKQVALPPVPHAARRQMLLVEPERWFVLPANAPVAIALNTGGTLAFAADGTVVEAWVAACAPWAPVLTVDAAPITMARAFAAAGLRNVVTAADAAAGELGIVAVQEGLLRTVRRVRVAALDASPPESVRLDGVDAPFVAAYGATLAATEDTATMLLTTGIERQFARAQRRRVMGWSAAAIAATCTAVWALGVSREQMLRTIERDVAAARAPSAPAAVAVARVIGMDQELAAITATTASRADALAALAALGARLPAEAVAQRVRMVGTEWQVEGNAVTASAVLAALAAEPRFDRVRFLAPSNRFRDGTEDRETFAIAFAVR